MTHPEELESVLRYLDVHAPELATVARERIAEHHQMLADFKASLFVTPASEPDVLDHLTPRRSDA